MKFPVFDLHCDTAFAMLGEDGEICHALAENALHFDLNRAQEYPSYVQCFACFTSDRYTLHRNVDPVELFAQERNCILSSMASSPLQIRQALSADDILANQQRGLISGILTIEGTAGFAYDIAALRDLYEQGYRITTLGWNEKNPLAGSHCTGGGLSLLGERYVAEAQRLGMLIDVSHISDEAFWDIIRITKAPVIASHSNSRSIWNVSRNLTDEMFKAICRTGGVVGINLYSEFLGQDPDLDTVCDHVLHFLYMDTDCRHICLGGDLDGCDSLPAGFSGVQGYQPLAEHMSARGIADEYIYRIFWDNAMRLFMSVGSKS